MQTFTVTPLDGSPSRTARHICFAVDGGVAAGAVIDRADGTMYTYSPGMSSVPDHDLATSALDIARMLHRHHDTSLLVYPDDVTTLRGDEARSADVYPPGRHPRIVLS